VQGRCRVTRVTLQADFNPRYLNNQSPQESLKTRNGTRRPRCTCLDPNLKMRAKRVHFLYVRESTFIKSHTNEFCGKKKCADEPDVAEIPPKIGRWVYERGNLGRLAKHS
jgi:hypothetical protein